MRDIKPAQGEDVFVLRPLAADQLDVEAFFLEKTFFDGGINRGFAGEPDVADFDFGEAGFCIKARGGWMTIATKSQCSATENTEDTEEGFDLVLHGSSPLAPLSPITVLRLVRGAGFLQQGDQGFG